MHDYILAIDFDRTLSDEASIDRLMYEACAAAGIDVGELQKTKASAEAGSESFSILDYLHQTEDTSTVTRIVAAFREAAKNQSPLYPDAAAFLDALRARSIEHLILTQGTVKWQELKIIAAQIHESSYLITDEKDKGKEIAGWRTASGQYQLPGGSAAIARQIVLIDDKANSFTSLPKDCRGFLVRRPHEAVMPSQTGQIPQNVVSIASLTDILTELS